MRIVNLLKYTNENVLRISEDIPVEVITFLDPTIEKLHFDENDNKILIHLQFRGKEEILLNDPAELNNYLSSGTVKGMIIFNEDKYKEFKKSAKKPSSFCKEDLKMAEVKSYDFVKNYFRDPMVLVTAIRKYHEMSRVPRGEYTLLDLLR
jgi:hypothetical protein